jgi:hypothetical protein
MEIKKIVVCGDSVCSATTDPTWYGHFSDLLADNGYNVINLARGGITNTGICFQLAEAINLNASLVIFNRTDSSRIDIPLRPFLPAYGLKNFIYPYPSDSSFGSPYVGGLDANILSDMAIGALVDRNDTDLVVTEEVKTAVKYYVSYLHDSRLMEVKETWMIEYWIQQLEKASIPFIELGTTGIGKILWDYMNNNPDKLNQCIYHTDKVTQKMLADCLICEIEKLKIS